MEPLSSPLGDPAVVVPPDRVAPRVSRLVRAPYRGLVDLHPQSGRARTGDASLSETEHAGVGNVVEKVGALVVVDADRVLLDQEVRSCERDLEAGCEGDRAERAVRGELGVPHFGERG